MSDAVPMPEAVPEVDAGNASQTERAVENLDLYSTDSSYGRCLRCSNSSTGSFFIGRKVARLVDELGAVLSIADRTASCWWGCAGGDHAIEYLLGSCVGTTNAALRLAYLGYYDESITSARHVAERQIYYHCSESTRKRSPIGDRPMVIADEEIILHITFELESNKPDRLYPLRQIATGRSVHMVSIQVAYLKSMSPAPGLIQAESSTPQGSSWL